MSAWLFQSMPEDFRLTAFLNSSPQRALWKVSRYGNKMLIGDRVYLWQGIGKLKPPLSGIFACGMIIKGPHECDDYELSAQYWLDPINALRRMERVLVAIENFKTSPIISRKQFLEDQVLNACSIMRMSQGSNFALTTEQAHRISQIYS
jgi:hypothetical protein